MKTRAILPVVAGLAMFFVASAGDAHAFGLFNRMFGGGCGSSCCEQSCCAPEPTCGCEPACGCEPSCGCGH